MQNPFVNPAFNATSLSAAINLIPNRYGRIGELGIFGEPKGVATTTVTIEENNGVLTLLPTQVRGGPSTLATRGKRKRRTFDIPYIPYDDHASPTDIQNLIAFGTENTMETMSAWVNDLLANMRMRHDQTLEWHRMGSLKGQLLDADGSSVIYNWYNEFGISKVTSYGGPAANVGKYLELDLLLGTSNTNVVQLLWNVSRHIEDNLQGETYRGVRALVSQSLFDKLVTHPNIVKIYQNWAAAQDKLGGDIRKGFTVGGITFEEYRATNIGSDGTSHAYIADGYGQAFPEGTTQTFRTFAGPADFNESVNKLGQLYYAKIEEAKFGRGWDIHTQMNPLVMCMRPSVLVTLKTSN
jgi:hypothetical protein